MMAKEDREALEEQVKAAQAARDIEHAATLAVKSYGPEILGFLHALESNEAVVAEAFSQFCEDLWKGLDSFEWRAALRSFLYTLARHALYRTRRGERRRRRHESPMESWRDAQEALRSDTMLYLRTEVKNRITQLRESLPEEDQMLLILRVDRQLEWKELAQVLSGERDRSDATLKREAARLRKRFQFVKERLQEMARAEGLLGEEG